ncbi:MAG: hypothetical protein ACLFV7_13375 [Phycisphaerae bacterium]
MTEEQNTDIQRLSPDKLLASFNRTPIIVYIVAALAIHLVAFGADYAMLLAKGSPTDPNQAVASSEDANEPATQPADANQPATTTNKAGKTNGKVDERVKGTPMEKELTETRPAPSEPLLNLDDTN